MPLSKIVQNSVDTPVAGTGPAFSAYPTSNQTPSAATFTKVSLQGEEFDTASCFDSSTNYRFTPNVAGYYQVNGAIRISAATARLFVLIYKNGAASKSGFDVQAGSQLVYSGQTSALIYMNGTTDYLELYVYTSTSAAIAADPTYTYFQASLARAA